MSKISKKHLVFWAIIFLASWYFIVLVLLYCNESRITKGMVPIKTADSIIDLYRTQTYRAIDLCKKYASMSDSLSKEINKIQKSNHGK